VFSSVESIFIRLDFFPIGFARSGAAMHFQVSRNGQTYGPYTLEDLQRYVASGNVLQTDLAKSEEMADWLPVSQILGNASPVTPAGVPSAFPQAHPSTEPGQAPLVAAAPLAPAAYPAAAAYPTPYASPATYAAPTAGALAASRYPDPPNLHWGLVLLLAVVTNGLFQLIWEFIQCAWLKKVQPDATALAKYITAYAMLFGGLIVAIIAGVLVATTSQTGNTPVAGILLGLLAAIGYFGGIIMIFVARFSERASLEQHFNGPEPVGLKLSGAMTFFFGSLYFQYHFNRINELKTAARMGVPAVY
jgi:hypothetical protein